MGYNCIGGSIFQNYCYRTSFKDLHKILRENMIIVLCLSNSKYVKNIDFWALWISYFRQPKSLYYMLPKKTCYKVYIILGFFFCPFNFICVLLNLLAFFYWSQTKLNVLLNVSIIFFAIIKRFVSLVTCVRRFFYLFNCQVDRRF